MAFNQQAREKNENLKFVESDGGDTAVRVKLVDGVRLSEGSKFEIKDHRGFVIFSIDEETGDIRHKGAFIKI